MPEQTPAATEPHASRSLSLSEQLPSPAGPPSAKAIRVRNGKGEVKELRGKTKRFLDRMVWEGLYWDDAARAEGMNVASARKALARPHVQRYVREQRQVFRASVSAQNISRAVEIRDQDENRTAAIQAIKYLDGLDDRDSTNAAGKSVTPGVVVQITVNQPAPQIDDLGLIELNPLSDNEPVSNEG